MAASIRELAEEASFIFEGTLRRTGAVTTSVLQPAPDMAVVHVKRILRGPPQLAKFSGREVTVQLRSAGAPEHDREVTFFTTGLSYGSGLALREVGHVDAHGPEVEKEVQEADEEKRNELLLRRLRSAEIVVSGKAVRTAEYPAAEGTPRRVTEHDPDWWECLIRIREVEKGEVRREAKGRAAEIATLFAHSIDILWYQSPKFSVGDEGIWLLHATDFRGNPVPAMVSDHPLDFHPLAELEHIRALLERLRH